MRDPYEVLGLREGTSKDEIKKRYDMLIRRNRAYKIDPENNPLDFNMDEATAAYNNLLGYDLKAEDPNAGKNRPFLKMFKLDPAKFDNFWHYNKVKLLVMIISAGLLTSLIVSIATNKPADFYIKLVGELYLTDENATTIKTDINISFEDIERSMVDVPMGFGDEDPTVTMAMIQRFAAEMAAREIDIIICDWNSYYLYMRQGFFMPLDELIPQELLLENQKYYYKGLANESDPIEGYFGININDIGLFEDVINIRNQEELIFCIAVNTQRLEKVERFIERYILSE